MERREYVSWNHGVDEVPRKWIKTLDQIPCTDVRYQFSRTKEIQHLIYCTVVNFYSKRTHASNWLGVRQSCIDRNCSCDAQSGTRCTVIIADQLADGYSRIQARSRVWGCYLPLKATGQKIRDQSKSMHSDRSRPATACRQAASCLRAPALTLAS